VYGIAPNGRRNIRRHGAFHADNEENRMNAIIYLVGLVVIVMFILSFIGLR
jgi:hypothetical protein